MGSESTNNLVPLPASPASETAGCAAAELKSRGALAAIVIVLVTAALYSASFVSLDRAWRDTVNHTYTHGYLVAAVSLWLLLRRRVELTAAPLAIGPGAIPAIALLALVWLVGLLAPIQVLHQVALPLVIWVAVYGLAGWRVARLCALPIGYFYFAIPIWDYGVEALQGLSIVAVRSVLHATSIPVYFRGELVEIPTGTFLIEGGCSGLHFLIIALALAVLHGEVSRSSMRARAKLVALAIVCALVSNWIRISVIIIAGHVTQMRHYLVTVDHYYFGWFVFMVAMIFFFVIGARWTRDPVSQHRHSVPPRPAPALAGRSMLVAVLCMAPIWYVVARQFTPPALAITLPEGEGEWRGPWRASSDLSLFAAADRQVHGRYAHANREIDVHIAGYSVQAQGKKISGYGAADHSADEAAMQKNTAIAAGDEYAETHVRAAAGASVLIWTRYEVGSRSFTHAPFAQLWYGLRSLWGMPAVRVVSLRTTCTPDCAAARVDLARFAGAMLRDRPTPRESTR